MTLQVDVAALMSAARAWEDTSEQVRGARKSLDDIDPALLGSRVASAAEAFIETWAGEIRTLQTDAVDHGDALREAALLVHRAETDTVAQVQQLLAWTDRDATSTGGPS